MQDFFGEPTPESPKVADRLEDFIEELEAESLLDGKDKHEYLVLTYGTFGHDHQVTIIPRDEIENWIDLLDDSSNLGRSQVERKIHPYATYDAFLFDFIHSFSIK